LLSAEADGKIVRHDRFVDFITPPRVRCGWPPENVEALIKDDHKVLTLWRRAIAPSLAAGTLPGVDR